MTDKAIEAATDAVQKALNDELDWCSREGGHIDDGRIASAAVAAYEANLRPGPGAILELVEENTRLRAQVKRMREALGVIASQKTPDELRGILDAERATYGAWATSSFDHCPVFDWESGYDECVRAARAAMEG